MRRYIVMRDSPSVRATALTFHCASRRACSSAGSHRSAGAVASPPGPADSAGLSPGGAATARADLPERGFVERTSGAIIVLLVFLLIMNATAVVLRSRFEKRW
jgi:hypothetical protein